MARALVPIATPKGLRHIPAGVTPEVMQIILLDELVGRLEEAKDLLEDMTTDGILESQLLNVTDRKTEFVPKSPLKSFTAFNNGPSAVRISVNEYQEQLADVPPTNSGETLSVDAKKHTIRGIYFICSSGLTATVYVQGLR